MIIRIKKKPFWHALWDRLNKRKWVSVSVVIVGLLLLAGVYAGFVVLRGALDIRSEVGALQTAVRAGRLDEARTHLAVVGHDINDIHAVASRVAFLKYIPLVGRYIDAAVKTSEGAGRLVHAGDELLRIANEVTIPIHTADGSVQIGHLTDAQKAAVLTAVDRNSSQLQGAKAEVDLARTSFDAIDDSKLDRKSVV